MLFVGVALVVAIGIALLVSADAGGLIGLTQNQTGQLIPGIIILVLVASALFSRRQRLGTMLGNVMLWIGIFGVAVVGYTYRDDLSGIAARVMGELTPGGAVSDSERGTATFRAGRDGHYQINAMINGSEVRTIFDTGASAVVLTEKDAIRPASTWASCATTSRSPPPTAPAAPPACCSTRSKSVALYANGSAPSSPKPMRWSRASWA